MVLMQRMSSKKQFDSTTNIQRIGCLKPPCYTVMLLLPLPMEVSIPLQANLTTWWCVTTNQAR
jgi:hypothetical protein